MVDQPLRDPDPLTSIDIVEEHGSFLLIRAASGFGVRWGAAVIGPFARTPHLRPRHALRTVREGFLDIDDQDERRNLAICRQPLLQGAVAHDPALAADTQRVAPSGDDEEESHFGMRE